MPLLKVDHLLPEQLLNSLIFSVVITDLEGRFQYVNPLFQYKFSNIAGNLSNTHFADTVFADDIRLCNQAARECIRHPEKHTTVVVRKASDEADYFWTQWEISAVKNEQGYVVGIMSVGHDITTTDSNTNKTQELTANMHSLQNEKKEMQAALVKSEDEVKRLALVAQNTTNSVSIADKDANIIWVNEGFTRITGYALEDVKNKKIGYSLEDPKADERSKTKLLHALQNKLAFKEEFLTHTKNGTAIWLEVDCQPLFDETNTHIGFMSIENDITRRRQAQQVQQELVQRLTLATDSAQIGIWEIDLKDKKIIWDDKMFELYGFEKNTPFAPQKIWKTAMHPDDLAMMEHIIGDLTAGKKDIDAAIYRITMPNGKTRHIESHAIVKKSRSGKVLRLIGTNRNISDDIAVQEKLKTQNKVLRDIAFIQSHEVRRPLANILGVIEVLNGSNSIHNKEIFDHLIESANELDMQIRSIVKKTNNLDGIFSKA
ncbi:MAG: PAS domain S-box protein [Sphingobacteriia bacterium]|nr:MAG: PAS domain S-box protein [Sphingobacteriia bacterium]